MMTSGADAEIRRDHQSETGRADGDGGHVHDQVGHHQHEQRGADRRRRTQGAFWNRDQPLLMAIHSAAPVCTQAVTQVLMGAAEQEDDVPGNAFSRSLEGSRILRDEQEHTWP